MIPLMQHEAAVYYASQWYRDQIAARKQRLINEGWLVPETIPAPRASVVVRPVLH